MKPMMMQSDPKLLLDYMRRSSGTEIPEGLECFKIQRYDDDRGFFQQDLNSSDLSLFGFKNFFQKNISKSRRGVVRGMHWQESEAAQTKIVSCLQGSVIDVVIDLRKTSSTYASITSFELNSNIPILIRIPKGFAHGFQALEDDTIFSYYVDTPYDPSKEMSLSPLSDELDSFWSDIPQCLSQKDRAATTYSDYFSRKREGSANV